MSLNWRRILSESLLTQCGKGCYTLDQLKKAISVKVGEDVSKDALYNAHKRWKDRLSLKPSLTDYLEEPKDEEEEEWVPKRPEDIKFALDPEVKRNLKKCKKFIITSAMNNCDLDENLWASIVNYAKYNKAQILVVPVRYKNPTSPPETYVRDRVAWWAEEIKPFATDELIKLHPKLWLMAHVRVQATAVNPLSGLEALSEGASAIFGHSQLALKMVATPQNSYPKLMYTTMSVTEPIYSDTKAGIKGEFHHNAGALVVEKDGSKFHVRNLCADKTGSFYDLDKYYTPKGVYKSEGASALIVGDEHVMFNDKKCRKATYGKDGICDVVKPKKLVRHDVFDGYSVSHWNRKDPLIQISKHRYGHHLLENELQETVVYINETTPPDSENIITSANHHEHILRWMKEVNAPSQEPWNAEIWLDLWKAVINSIEFKEHGVVHSDPFALWCAPKMSSKTRWLSKDEDCVIEGIEVGMHGHAGINGSRGTLNQFSKIGVKSVVGHSHTPGIKHGAYQVGTSSTLKMEYTSGPSSWAHCHCIIYPNGKRQMIFVINGCWKS